MRDSWGRTIDYLRLSLTDRCNLHCTYCMPENLPHLKHADILRYEEILTICQAAVLLGINRFKVTGGEPLVRRGAISFIRRLVRLPGVSDVTLTTNGQKLAEYLDDLAEAGVSSINISLDTLDAAQYSQLTGGGHLSAVLAAVKEAVNGPYRIKINAVLLEETKQQILPLAELAWNYPLDVRFIELMPIGYGRSLPGLTAEEALKQLKKAYPQLQSETRQDNGPAVYYSSPALQGDIGFIAANTHQFCQSCNRMRLTSTGFLKPCLCYDTGVSLRDILRGSQIEDIQPALRQAIQEAVRLKPQQHCFADEKTITEHKTMNQIGG